MPANNPVDLTNEAFLTLAEAAKLVPGHPSMNTIWRWCREGVKVRGTLERIRLRHVRAGGRVLTTKAWLDEMLHAVAQADLRHFDHKYPCAPKPSAPQGRTPEARAAAVAAAKAILGS